MQKRGLERKGSYILVIRVQELKSKDIFAAKGAGVLKGEPYLRRHQHSKIGVGRIESGI